MSHIDDLIDKWHDSDSALELHEYLGWTYGEYAAWVEGKMSLEDQILEVLGNKQLGFGDIERIIKKNSELFLSSEIRRTIWKLIKNQKIQLIPGNTVKLMEPQLKTASDGVNVGGVITATGFDGSDEIAEIAEKILALDDAQKKELFNYVLDKSVIISKLLMSVK